MDKVKKKLKDLDKTQDLIGLLEREMKATEVESQSLKEQLLNLASHSRKNNLFFERIKEEERGNTTSEVYKFLCTALGFTQQECQRLIIASCHRLGRKVGNTHPRPSTPRGIMYGTRNIY